MSYTSPPLESKRALFDIPRDVAYLNCGYMSPLSHAVREAGERGVGKKARPWEIGSSDFFDDSERARGLFARLLGVPADRVALAPSASYGLAAVAHNAPVAKGQSILVLAEQFPSNVYPWRELARRVGADVVTVPRPTDDDWTSVVLSHIDDRTALAALPACHWTDGGRVDLATVAAALRQRGAHLVVDVTQSLGAMPFDVEAVRPDALVAAGYKWLMGPYSQAFLYVGDAYVSGDPIEHNWITRAGAEDFARLVHYRDELQEGARRFDVGERSNFALVPMMARALEQVLEWGVERIHATAAAMTSRIAKRAAELGIDSVPEKHRAGHYLGLRFGGGVPEGLAAKLAAESVYVSVRGNSVRVTPHVYNDQEDVERLLEVLERARR